MKMYCESPVILQNPQLKNLILRHKHYCINGEMHTVLSHKIHDWLIDFPYSNFSPKKLGVDIEKLDTYYVFNPVTSECFPMFISVPCQKCIFCRDKKAREWSFRAVCESRHSSSMPLFVTLTYAPKFLPSDGVEKSEIQNFMKRLRIQLERDGYGSSELRYFACAEYGTKSGRAHYHLILWNYPQMRNKSETLHSVEKAWSKIVGYQPDGSPLRVKMGHCYVLPCESGGIKYVMKYMRKQACVPPGKNDIFFLSSRRNGGIGAAYAREVTPYYHKNPNVLDISINDKFSGELITISLPAYFKNLIFPPMSKLVKKDVRDAVKILQHNLSLRSAVWNVQKAGYCHLEPSVKSVLKKFSFLGFRSQFRANQNDYSYLTKYASDQLTILNSEITENIRYYTRLLSNIVIDMSYIERRNDILSKRNHALVLKFMYLPDIDLNGVKLSLLNARSLAYSKEKI